MNSSSLHNQLGLLLVFSVVLFSSASAQWPCEVAYEREIVNTNSKRMDMAPQFFFSFTHPELKTFYKENNFINTFAQLSKNNGALFLNLNVKLSSSVAKENYGFISTENTVTIKLIKGGQVELQCAQGSLGIANDASNHTIYAVSYQLDKSDIRKLIKYEIDKVGIEWSSGYEEYEVYEVDVLMHQLKCLEKFEVL